MIKTKALEKAVKYLSSKKITEVGFTLNDGKGQFRIYQKGTTYEITVSHDDTSIRVEEKKVKWL